MNGDIIWIKIKKETVSKRGCVIMEIYYQKVMLFWTKWRNNVRRSQSRVHQLVFSRSFTPFRMTKWKLISILTQPLKRKWLHYLTVFRDCFELIKEKCYGHYKYIPNAFKTWNTWVILPMQTASFYGFRPKTVRSPSQNRMFLVRKPYVFGTENVKGRLLETDVLFTFATYCASNTITNRTGFPIIFGGKVKGNKKTGTA